MKTTDWRAEYTSYKGYNIAQQAKYVSVAGSSKSGTGSRENPYNPTASIPLPIYNTFSYVVLGNGTMELTASGSGWLSMVGQSKEGSIVKSVRYDNKYLELNNLTYVNLKNSLVVVTNCILRDVLFLDTQYNSNCSITNSIFYGKPAILRFREELMTSRCTFVHSPILESIFRSPTALLVECEVIINATTLSSYANYLAFNNCSFMIGAETSATPLVGESADELHANFVERCNAQDLILKSANDDQTNTPVDRWIFSKTSVAGDYELIQNSEIHQFSKPRGFYFGHTDQVVKHIPIKTEANIPASFTPTSNSHKDTLIQNNSIGLLATSSIEKRTEAYADSKIIWLGGFKKLSALSVTHNLPTQSGVAPDSVYGLSSDSTLDIEPAKHYIIRSEDTNMASIKYNGVEYTSSLIGRNNVFVGVEGVTDFSDLYGNASVYQVLDFANHQTLQIRLIKELPTPKITSGNLEAGYWYFVEPLDLEDTTASITYKGIVRPAFDSFLVDSNNLTFTGVNKAHLRRCWKHDFDVNAEDTDKSFWSQRQKPYYYDVVPNDLRGMLLNNSSASVELATIDNKYVGSGHPDFYNKVNGITGLPSPAYDLVGTYLQIRVPITTTNLM